MSAVEDGVGLDGVHEDVLGDLVPETGRYHLHELVELLLVVQVILGLVHELPDIVLEELWEFHVEHGGVGHVNLLLDLLAPSVESGEHYSHGSEDVGNDEGAHDRQKR